MCPRSAEESTVRIVTLGAWIVLVGEREVLQNRPHLRAFFTFLALEGSATRSELMTLFWPDVAPESARRSLNQAVYLIRKDLGPGSLETVNETIGVGSAVSVDLTRALGLLEAGDLSSGLAEITGPFIPPTWSGPSHDFERWTTRWESRLSRAARIARASRITELVALGRHPEALEIASAWVAADPLEDEAQHLYIELLHRLGRRGAALSHFEQYRRVLWDELSVEPLEGTVDLVGRIRADTDGRPVGPLPAGPEVKRLPRPRRTRRALVAMPVLAAAVGLVWSTSQPQAGEVLSVESGRVAIFDFEDRSADGSLAVVARGLTRGVIYALASVDAIEVVPHHGTAGLRPPDVASDEVVRRLAVGTVVLGTVQRIGAEVVVHVQLVDANDQTYSARSRIVTPASQVLDLQDQLSELVAHLLRVELGRQLTLEVRRSSAVQESWLAVNAAQDLAEHLWRAQGPIPDQTAVGASALLASADSLLDVGAVADPMWSEPILLKARVEVARAKLVDQAASRMRYLAHLERAWDWADSALSILPDDSRALGVLGAIAYEQARTLRLDDGPSASLQMALADSLLGLAVRADAKNAEAWATLGEVQRMTGRVGASRASALRALEADPYLENASDILHRLIISSLEVEEPAEALTWVERGLRNFPQDRRFAEALLTVSSWSGVVTLPPDSIDRVLEHLERLETVRPSGLLREYSYIYRQAASAGALVRSGEVQRARRTMDSLRVLVDQQPAWQAPFSWDDAHVSWLLADTARTVEQLAFWLRTHPVNENYLKSSFLFRDLTSDAEAWQLIRRTAREGN